LSAPDFRRKRIPEIKRPGNHQAQSLRPQVLRPTPRRNLRILWRSPPESSRSSWGERRPRRARSPRNRNPQGPAAAVAGQESKAHGGERGACRPARRAASRQATSALSGPREAWPWRTASPSRQACAGRGSRPIPSGQALQEPAGSTGAWHAGASAGRCRLNDRQGSRGFPCPPGIVAPRGWPMRHPVAAESACSPAACGWAPGRTP
jgi:hypothetical protein